MSATAPDTTAPDTTVADRHDALMDQASARAVGHIAAQSRGGPIDPAWRTTVHFHPDRASGGTPVLYLVVEQDRYRSQF